MKEGIVIATCELCGHEVQFPVKEKQRINNEGDKCRHCQTPVILVEIKKKPNQLKKVFYYTAYLKCPKCKTFYMQEKFKVYTGKKYTLKEQLGDNYGLFTRGVDK